MPRLRGPVPGADGRTARPARAAEAVVVPVTCPRCDCDDCRRERDPLGYLLEQCRDLDIVVAADWTVSSHDAARLLGVSVQYLASDRCYYGRYPAIRRGRRARYDLRDIARHSVGADALAEY